MTALDYADPIALAQANMEWRDATTDLRTELFDKAYAKHEKAIRKEREAKVQPQNVWTRKQIDLAKNMARADVLQALSKMREHNGVMNPVANDPEWGLDSAEAKQAAAPTPNKYAGKCVKCQGWIEAKAGKLVKVNGRFGAQHIDECPKAQPRPNRYAGMCGTCGQEVKANEGRIEKSDAGQWVTFHLDGQCPEVSAEATEAAQDGLDLSGLVPGYYAVPGGTRLKLAINHGRKGGKWDGYTFVKDASEYGAGKRYGMQRPGQAYRGQVQDELAEILKDPKAAMVAYGKLVGRCGACGRKLEDEASVAAGIGPVCAEKF